MNEITRITKLAGLNEAIDDDFHLSDEDMERMDAEDLARWRNAMPILSKKLDDWMEEVINSYPDMVNVDNEEYDRLMGALGKKAEDFGYRIRTGNL